MASSADDANSWFRKQTWETAPPATGRPLAERLARRSDASFAERAVRETALHARGLPMPPQELVDWVGGGDAHVFHTVGLLNTWQVMVYAGLERGHRVLEPGCGCGRNARFLAPFLDPERGGYEGFDVHRPSIDWATANVTAAYPNVRFTWADVANTNYNPAGATTSGAYVFPWEGDTFDVAFLPSVFTHLTRDGFEHYVREIARVLVPGGRLLSWHFLLDETARERVRAGSSALPLQDYDAVSSVLDPENPCAAIAYDEGFVLDVLEAAGLHPQFVAHGRWSGRVPDGLFDAQDRVLSVKGG